MKSLGTCLESLLDDEDVFYGTDSDKKVIERWIRDNYRIRDKLTILDDLVVDCSGSVDVKNRSVTSLEGTPKEVSNFYCRNCNKITSLKGAPEWVGGDFYCGGCPNLKITKSDRKKYKIEN